MRAKSPPPLGPSLRPPTRGRSLAAALCLLVLFRAVPLVAFPAPQEKQQGKQKVKKPPQLDPLEAYLQRARVWGALYIPTLGSLWDPDARMADLASDDKAIHKGDLITIQLAEATTSALQQSAQTQRAFSATSGISAFFGTLS